MDLANDFFEMMTGACEMHNNDTSDYLHEKGDVMLELLIERKDHDNCTLELRLRERPIYHDGKLHEDILQLSGIEVPELQIIASIPALDIASGSDWVQYNSRFYVSRTNLSEAACQLFSVIKKYEAQTIQHPAGFTAVGVGRNAHVSVTNMDKLHGFDIPALKNIPSRYHSADAKCRKIYLP